jgi:hypothetical protein
MLMVRSATLFFLLYVKTEDRLELVSWFMVFLPQRIIPPFNSLYLQGQARNEVAVSCRVARPHSDFYQSIERLISSAIHYDQAIHWNCGTASEHRLAWLLKDG